MVVNDQLAVSEQQDVESGQAEALVVKPDEGPGALKAWLETARGSWASLTLSEPEAVRYATWISIWGRWFIWLIGVFLLAYRPDSWYPERAEAIALIAVNLLVIGLVSYRLFKRRPNTQRLLLLLSAADVAQIACAVYVLGGYSTVVFLAFYPALGLFAVLFSSLWLTFAWTSLAAVLYVAICVWTGAGVDLELGQEKVLVGRVATMYVVAVCIGLIVRFERLRWRSAVTREQQLRRDRIELSQQIHDTTAQTAFMINLGIHRAKTLAGESNKELLAALEATSSLSKSAMWEMRGPIDVGHIIEGRELGQVMSSHCATYERITGIPTTMTQTGIEPLMPTVTRTRLFSITHNALTNAFLHANPSKVEVSLSFASEHIVLRVMDDGVGLPNDYAQHGRGISGMMEDAARMGGVLTLDSEQERGGTTIICMVPRHGDSNGD